MTAVLRLICEQCESGYHTNLAQCPYCNTSSAFAHQVQLEPLVVDTECYPNYWLLRALHVATGELHTFESFPGKLLDIIGVRNLLTSHKLVTFNGRSYDIPMITYALTGADTASLKQASDAIITQNLQPWQFYQAFGLNEPSSLDHIDLIEVAPGTGSLKAYGGKMHTRKLQDLPYPPDMRIEWPHRLFLKEYCANDLFVTAELWNTFQTQIALREAMSEEYGVDLRSKSDAQISEAAMIAVLGYKPDRPTVPPATQFVYQPPEWLKFNTPILQDVLRIMSTCPFSVTPTGGVSPAWNNHLVDWGSDQVRLDIHGQWIKKPEGWAHTPVRIGDTMYALGSGGLHSMESCVTWRANEKRSLRMPDVASYYPSLILETGIYPAAIGPQFAPIYRGWYNDRLRAKAEGRKKDANSGKTKLNGGFGKLGSKWSIFYTPNGMIQVTVTGQLALLMLIEALESAGIPVVSANTDGLVIYAPRELDWLADSIIAWWESITGFVMETSEFKLLAARDVNSYVAITSDGEVKLKGAFAPAEPGASGWPNPTGQICTDAIVAYLRDAVPLADTIRACTDIRQFVYVRSVTGGGQYNPNGVLPRKTTQTAMYDALGVQKGMLTKDDLIAAYDRLCDERASGAEYLGKVVRWYYRAGATGCITYKTSGNLVPRTEGCQPLMELPDTLPQDIDYEWYIREAESMLIAIDGTVISV